MDGPWEAALEISVEFADRVACSGDLLAFSIGTRRIVVQQILDRWPGPDYCYMKLLGEDEAIYIVRHDERVDRWVMTLFQADPRQAHPIDTRTRQRPLPS